MAGWLVSWHMKYHIARKFCELRVICQTKIIQTLHRKFYDYLSRDINNTVTHILNGPSTMQVMDPPKPNTIETFTWGHVQ